MRFGGLNIITNRSSISNGLISLPGSSLHHSSVLLRNANSMNTTPVIAKLTLWTRLILSSSSFPSRGSAGSSRVRCSCQDARVRRRITTLRAGFGGVGSWFHFLRPRVLFSQMLPELLIVGRVETSVLHEGDRGDKVGTGSSSCQNHFLMTSL